MVSSAVFNKSTLTGFDVAAWEIWADLIAFLWEVLPNWSLTPPSEMIGNSIKALKSYRIE
jgi:hypothetical protein